MNILNEEEEKAVLALIETILEMEAYNDVPGPDGPMEDPVWRAIWTRGAEALRGASKAFGLP